MTKTGLYKIMPKAKDKLCPLSGLNMPGRKISKVEANTEK